MQKLIIIGNLGEDAKVVDLQGGKQVINFSLAVTEKFKEEKVTTWFRCAQFTNNVSLAPYLTRGSKVAVVGKPGLETYVANDGSTKANLKCIVFELELINSTKTQNETGTPQPTAAAAAQPFEPATNFQEEEHDDLPF